MRSPFVDGFAPKARALGGKWNREDSCWVFSPRYEEQVRALLRSVYGWSEDDSSARGVVRVSVSKEWDWRETSETAGMGRTLQLYLFGRLIARAFDRDSGARLGEGVVVLEGGFESGGSRKNPEVYARKGTVFEIAGFTVDSFAALVNQFDSEIGTVEFLPDSKEASGEEKQDTALDGVRRLETAGHTHEEVVQACRDFLEADARARLAAAGHTQEEMDAALSGATGAVEEVLGVS